MLGFCVPMPSANTSRKLTDRPRVGIPWRTTQEELEGSRQKLDYYFEAVRKAGGEPVEVSLRQPSTTLWEQLNGLDGFVLPGSPADVDPARYGAPKHHKTNDLDENRDTTDIAILDHSFYETKPVLAICYGCQLLNVYLQGTLIQDIQSEWPASGPHGSTDLPPGAAKGDIEHAATFTPGSRLGTLNGTSEGTINSSHHQAIDRPGKNLRVTAKATDGMIEGVEWNGDSNWVVGVQWHPERMVGDPFAERLFAEFVGVARHHLLRDAHGSVARKA
jgi:putative glutamine amidotransferase